MKNLKLLSVILLASLFVGKSVSAAKEESPSTPTTCKSWESILLGINFEEGRKSRSLFAVGSDVVQKKSIESIVEKIKQISSQPSKKDAKKNPKMDPKIRTLYAFQNNAFQKVFSKGGSKKSIFKSKKGGSSSGKKNFQDKLYQVLEQEQSQGRLDCILEVPCENKGNIEDVRDVRLIIEKNIWENFTKKISEKNQDYLSAIFILYIDEEGNIVGKKISSPLKPSSLEKKKYGLVLDDKKTINEWFASHEKAESHSHLEHEDGSSESKASRVSVFKQSRSRRSTTPSRTSQASDTSQTHTVVRNNLSLSRVGSSVPKGESLNDGALEQPKVETGVTPKKEIKGLKDLKNPAKGEEDKNTSESISGQGKKSPIETQTQNKGTGQEKTTANKKDKKDSKYNKAVGGIGSSLVMALVLFALWRHVSSKDSENKNIKNKE